MSHKSVITELLKDVCKFDEVCIHRIVNGYYGPSDETPNEYIKRRYLELAKLDPVKPPCPVRYGHRELSCNGECDQYKAALVSGFDIWSNLPGFAHRVIWVTIPHYHQGFCQYIPADIDRIKKLFEELFPGHRTIDMIEYMDNYKSSTILEHIDLGNHYDGTTVVYQRFWSQLLMPPLPADVIEQQRQHIAELARQEYVYGLRIRCGIILAFLMALYWSLGLMVHKKCERVFNPGYAVYHVCTGHIVEDFATTWAVATILLLFICTWAHQRETMDSLVYRVLQIHVLLFFSLSFVLTGTWANYLHTDYWSIFKCHSLATCV